MAGDWVVYNLYLAGAYLFSPDNATNKVYVNEDIGLGPGVASVTYNLMVQVQDSHGDTDTANLLITVTDINDHAPVFNPRTYSGSVRGKPLTYRLTPHHGYTSYHEYSAHCRILVMKQPPISVILMLPTETDLGGTAVGITVTASDDDAGSNAAIVYSMHEDFANLYFEVIFIGLVTLLLPVTQSDISLNFLGFVSI